MLKLPEKIIYNNTANIVSILGVLPLCILFLEGGYQYLLPLIIYNNIMDDLDGILAVKMNIKSTFGAILDNLCDGISHSIFVMAVGMHYGGICAAAGLIAVVGILLRVVSRLKPDAVTGTGSPTNELIRHTMFILLLAPMFDLNVASLLTIVFTLHAVSMLVPYQMPYLIRSITKSATAIALVNIALITAWLVPFAAPLIASCFLLTYLYSFITGGIKWLNGTGTSLSAL
jgi:phosphatidylserine synthase